MSELHSIIAEIASRADDFLAGAPDRTHARAGIEEAITIDYPSLEPADRREVVAGVMHVLEDEGFFGIEFVGDPFTETDEHDEN